MKEGENITLRPLQQEDASFLCSIFKDNQEYYDIFFDSESNLSEWNDRVKHFIRQRNICHFIIEAKDTSVGWLSFFDEEPAEREIGILVVKKEDLCCGYGTKTLSWLIEKSRADNIRTLSLNVNQSNSRAIHLYTRFGFEIVAEEIIPQCNEAMNLAQYKMKLSLI